MNKYRAILTEAGLNKLAAATLTGSRQASPVWALVMAAERYTSPTLQTGLINELYRAPLNRLVIADQGAYYPGRNGDASRVGGFWLREAALYDDEGVSCGG